MCAQTQQNAGSPETIRLQRPESAFGGLLQGVRHWRLWMLLGWLDIRQRYARSRLGPFWITISMGVLVGSIALVYGTLFGQPMREYLPFIGIGFVLWGLISGTINDGCYAYINSANYVLQSDMPLWIYVLQVMWRQTVIFCHNAVIIVVLTVVYGTTTFSIVPLFFVGLLLIFINLLWMAQLVAVISARYRDVPQIVASIIQVLFYLTPLMWRPEMLSKYQWIIVLNPFAALIDVARSPLLGKAPQAESWIVVLVMALLGWAVTLSLSKKAMPRIAYWV